MWRHEAFGAVKRISGYKINGSSISCEIELPNGETRSITYDASSPADLFCGPVSKREMKRMLRDYVRETYPAIVSDVEGAAI